jgi:uncharacterized surface protein with fasciclin (FAS1) repeats
MVPLVLFCIDPSYYCLSHVCLSAEIACTTEGFAVLCAALGETDLIETLSGGSFTVFAPTDQAFEELLGVDPLGALGTVDIATLRDLLLYHAVSDVVITSDQVTCDVFLDMANEESTTM